MTIENNSGAPRWPARWFIRLPVQFVALFVAYLAAQISLGALRNVPSPLREGLVLPWSLIASAILIWIYLALVRLMERRFASELSFPAAARGLLLGTVAGLGLFTAVIAILLATGHASVALPAAVTFPVAALVLSVLSGVGEELIFRGALFRIVEERFGTLLALAVSALFFGGAHIFNPAATVTSSIAIALEAGLLLGLAYTATRSLWLPIGFHFGWNFTEGGLFTTEVSGGKIPGVLKTTLTGPDILTGGAFGPEASIVAVVVCVSAAAVFLWITLRRNEWKPLMLRARP